MACSIYCPTCQDDVDPVIEDASFSHEFGTEVVWLCHCPNCGNELPLPDPDEPDEME